jgi:catechol 2,3-dioxygenase-like lactoylglutathione lyase family enzyme
MTDRRGPDRPVTEDVRPALLGIHYVRVPVANVEEARDWCVEILGFNCILDYEVESGIVGALLVHSSGISVALHLAPDRSTSLDRFAVLSLKVDGLLGMRQWQEWLDQNEVGHSGLQPGHVGSYLEVGGPCGLTMRLHTPELFDADQA